MKIVIQSGRVIQKPDVEEFIARSPSSWVSGITSIVVGDTSDEEVKVNYYPPDKQLAIYIPLEYQGSPDDLIEEIAVCAQAIEHHKSLPKRLSKSNRVEFSSRWRELSWAGK